MQLSWVAAKSLNHRNVEFVVFSLLQKNACICNSMFQDPKLSFKSVQILLFIIWRTITAFNRPFGTRSGPVATWTYQPKLQMSQKRHGSTHATFHAVHPLQKLFGGVLIIWIAELLARPAPPPRHHPPILRTIKFLTAATSLKADYSSYSSCGHGRHFYILLLCLGWNLQAFRLSWMTRVSSYFTMHRILQNGHMDAKW